LLSEGDIDSRGGVICCIAITKGRVVKERLT
jgi:hypothetical protein